MLDGTQFFVAASDRFAAQCERATALQWKHRPSASDWSMGDVAEHVTIANRNIAKRLSTLTPLGERRSEVIDDEIPYLFYRGDEPPNVATPSGTWNSWVDHAEEYRHSVNAILTTIENAHFDLRTHGATHPVFGTLDGSQWLLFSGAHTERHRSQLIGLQRSFSA
jgi:hypothetical protein